MRPGFFRFENVEFSPFMAVFGWRKTALIVEGSSDTVIYLIITDGFLFRQKSSKRWDVTSLQNIFLSFIIKPSHRFNDCSARTRCHSSMTQTCKTVVETWEVQELRFQKSSWRRRHAVSMSGSEGESRVKVKVKLRLPSNRNCKPYWTSSAMEILAKIRLPILRCFSNTSKSDICKSLELTDERMYNVIKWTVKFAMHSYSPMVSVHGSITGGFDSEKSIDMFT